MGTRRPMSTDSSDNTRDPLERVAEEFAERQRRGQRPSVTEYIGRHPQWAEEIRELFPALVAMEQHKPGSDDRRDPSGFPYGGGGVPERLGDFRVLCEIGRGGMGIV